MNNNFQYDPDPASLILPPFNVTFLSQRDFELRIPINYVTSPGVSIAAACFAENRFEDYATVKCISNLLTTGFRRLDIDLYWDSGRRIWSFCPVMLPSVEDESSGSTIRPGSISSTGMSTLTNTQAAGVASGSSTSISTEATASMSPRDLDPRQFESLVGTMTDLDPVPVTPLPMTTATVVLSTVGTTPVAVLPTATAGIGEEVLFSVGPYICSGTSAVNILAQLLPSFLANTDNTLQAVMQIVVMNIHAAASITAPLEPAQAPSTSDLPGVADLVGQYFGNSSSYLYTPAILARDRANLNSSWLSVSSSSIPDESYFTTTTGGTGNIQMTPDGWPSASINEFQGDNHLRLLFGYGQIDPQMSDYNYVGDNATVFSPGYLDSLTQVTFSASGTVDSGCFYDGQSTSLSSANASWALASIPSSNLDPTNPTPYQANTTLAAPSNLTSCGISPFLNISLLNATADANITPYKHFAYSTIWSWSWNEPVSSPALSCAVLDPSLPGARWRAADCGESHRAACRLGNQPLAWIIGLNSAGYDDVSCPANASFSAPRSALEQAYLAAAAQAPGQTSGPIWLNVNSLDVQDCWVAGVNASCPYRQGVEEAQAQIYVPTVAGVVILIITVLLVIVKCGANRARSKRTRKGENGWDYEGVPA